MPGWRGVWGGVWLGMWLVVGCGSVLPKWHLVAIPPTHQANCHSVLLSFETVSGLEL